MKVLQKYGLFTSITEKNLNLVFNSHFHEALIEIMTVASSLRCKRDVEQRKDIRDSEDSLSSSIITYAPRKSIILQVVAY